MRRSILLFIACCLSLFAISQQTKNEEKNTVTVNTIRETDKKLLQSANIYPAFLDGKVIFKDSGVAEARMNYNRLYGQVLFISGRGDTLMLAHPETIDKVVIGADTFYYFDKSFLRRLTHFEGSNLHIMEAMKYIGSEKKGPYGIYTPLSASNSNSTFTNDDQVTQYISIDENKLFRKNTIFYLSDRFNNFFEANKNNFYKLFFNHEKEIREFIKTNKTNFDEQEDIVRLFQFVQSLLSA